ncbi:hypothetical protein DAY19_00015 [Halobacteriovorax vibrionivorans]|uniref:Uncharacterized protein n=1 Tax=Halobacteriovorax vibrionivorans TaxID=2152716 RepID=A0ABY0II10_9BACT|nr:MULTISPECIES: hypothetical protein [Halobacteriovorax]RZF22185.1 hypothetical protein DAY19_00015 [Halobacteriovorax vibrionivorans]TGD48437.1 hypothetical protein EP118_02930 [Halobacteriovorax sp. Y22]
MKAIIILSVILLTSQAFASNSCFYNMSEEKVMSLKKAKQDAYTLIYDASMCSDRTLLTLKEELMKASESKLSYLKARVEDSQSTLLGAFGSLGRHADMKRKYEHDLSKIQSALSLVLIEMNKRNL